MVRISERLDALLSALTASPPHVNAPHESVHPAHRERLAALRNEVARHFLGPRSAVDLLTVALLARGHALIEGVPGVAKTTLMKSFAAALGCSIRRIQFTPDLLPADITGTFVFSPKDGTFSLRAGPIFAHVVLADEVNRAPAKTQSALLEAMQERQVTIEGERYELPAPFFVVATQNPVDMEGTYPLPEAQIDRFSHRDPARVPHARGRDADDPHLRHPLRLKRRARARPRRRPGPARSRGQRSTSKKILMHYVVELTRATRKNPRVLLGASPARQPRVSCKRRRRTRSSRAACISLRTTCVRRRGLGTLAHRLLVDEEGEEAPKVRRAVVEEVLARTDWRRPTHA